MLPVIASFSHPYFLPKVFASSTTPFANNCSLLVGGVQKVLACSSPLSVIELEDLEEILENSIPSELDEVDEDVTEYDEDEDEEDFDDRSELNFDDD
jgi:hypothetical protein